MGRGPSPIPVMDRFMSKTEPAGGCLIWKGALARGYGRFRPGSSRTTNVMYAHRWIYEQTVGPIPEGLQIDHLCGNKPCVDVTHLEPVTQAENLARRGPRGRVRKP